jgi:hypothetical protein
MDNAYIDVKKSISFRFLQLRVWFLVQQIKIGLWILNMFSDTSIRLESYRLRYDKKS